MNKFFCLVIKADLSIQRTWMNSDMVLAMITAHKDIKIYRNSNDQVALLIEQVPGLTSLVWEDVQTVESIPV